MLFIEELSNKTSYTIRDLSKVFHKKSSLIKEWEKRGIIKKPINTYPRKNFLKAGWRKYSREEFIEVIEDVINYDWPPQAQIKNRAELDIYISYLKNDPYFYPTIGDTRRFNLDIKIDKNY